MIPSRCDKSARNSPTVVSAGVRSIVYRAPSTEALQVKADGSVDLRLAPARQDGRPT
jgi:hypothetical protein